MVTVASRIRCSAVSVSECRIASGHSHRCYVRAMRDGDGDPAVDAIYEVKRGHEASVRALMASSRAHSESRA